ncbi:MAG: hypothetical protein IKJ77_04285 [Firmicutes bacterium]|nr:hypothetical protein [Bacillota bacterium]
MKYPKSIFLTLIAVLLAAMMPLQVSAASMFSYQTKIDVQPGGQVYFNYGKNGRFFLCSDWEAYDEGCLVTSGTAYDFTKLLDRGMIARPDEGYYFAGFYDPLGKKQNLKETKLDILRISVKGFYFYNYFPSKDNPSYNRLTKTAYQNQVKLYLKGLYGVTRYKVMDTVLLYDLPKTDGNYIARFQKKQPPALNIPAELTKTYGNAAFRLVSNLPDDLNYSFKSSSTKVLTVNKKNGYITIKGPGRAKVTCKVKESATTLPASFVSQITVKPAKVKKLTAKRTKKALSVKWNASSKNSGYEIQVSNNSSFKNIIAKKSVSGGKTSSTTVKLKAEVCNNYVRIRPYKTSGGEKIYNQYTIAEIQ